MSRQPHPEIEIYVRLADQTMDFVYTIRHGGDVIEWGQVSPVDRVAPPATSGGRPELHAGPRWEDLELWGNRDAAQAFHSFLYGRAE